MVLYIYIAWLQGSKWKSVVSFINIYMTVLPSGASLYGFRALDASAVEIHGFIIICIVQYSNQEFYHNQTSHLKASWLPLLHSLSHACMYINDGHTFIFTYQ